MIQTRKKIDTTGIIELTLVVLWGVALAVVLYPTWRNQAKNYLRPEYRNVVSTLAVASKETPEAFQIVKVQTRDQIELELYRDNKNGKQDLVERITIPNQRDGFFDFEGKLANLALVDITGDGRPEILVPGFDRNLSGRMNVYSFDPLNSQHLKAAN